MKIIRFLYDDILLMRSKCGKNHDYVTLRNRFFGNFCLSNSKNLELEIEDLR